MSDQNTPSSAPAPSVESIDAEIQGLRKPIEGMLDSTRFGKIDSLYKTKSQLLAGSDLEPEGVKNFRREHGKPETGKASPAPKPLWQEPEPSDQAAGAESEQDREVRSHLSSSWGPRYEESAETLADAAREVFQDDANRFEGFVRQLPADSQIAVAQRVIGALKLPTAAPEEAESAASEAAERLTELWAENAGAFHEDVKQAAAKIFGSIERAEEFILSRGLGADAQIELAIALREIAQAQKQRR